MALVELGSDNFFTAGDLQTTGYFAAVTAYQKIYIADGRPYSATIGDSGYHKIDMVDTALVGEVTGTFTLGESVTQAISGATGVFIETIGTGETAKHIVYRTTTTEFDTSNVVTGADSGATVTPTSVKAPPLWLNWTLTDGTFPDGGSNVMALFEGRIFMNSMYNPNQWFATRQGDPLDLDDSVENDVQAAISSQSSEAGVVGDSLISLIPYKDNYLIFGLANSFYILRGGSTGSGALSLLTEETGIFSPDSYCWDNEGNLYVVGLNGFFKFPNGMATESTGIDNISFRFQPNLFKSLKLNRKSDRVVLGFDRDNYLINVSISMQDGKWEVCFVYDIKNDCIMPDSYATGCVPSSFLYANDYSAGESGLLVGCYDGYVRVFDPETKSDDGTAIDSYTLFGPIVINDLIRAKIKVNEIQINLSEDSDGLSWYLYAGKSPEEIVRGIKDGSLNYLYTGTFTSGGRQAVIRDKIAGESIAILFRLNTLNSSWGLEGIKIRYSIAGKEKGV